MAYCALPILELFECQIGLVQYRAERAAPQVFASHGYDHHTSRCAIATELGMRALLADQVESISGKYLGNVFR